MQGVRDYIKFLKRGFGRTSHLASIDIRNGRLDRDSGLEMVKKYDGRKPAALDRFLKMVNITEEQFMEIVEKSVVAPNVMPKLADIPKVNREPKDFKLLDERLSAFIDEN